MRGFERAAQDVFSLWSTQRLRDVVHQTLHLGAPASAAAATLRAAATAEVQGEGNPFEMRVSARAWVRATYLLSAELHEAVSVLRILEDAITEGGQANQHRAAALGALNAANYAGSGSELTPTLVEEALEEERAADAIDNRGRGRYHSIGGAPRSSDVGGTGDQILAVQLLRAAQELASQVEVMADMPCVQDWRQDHPQDALAHPLLTAVPEALFSGRWVGRVDSRWKSTTGLSRSSGDADVAT
ncbi:MAG: hypothetical protein ACRC35_07920 [Angustibacter sp.]